MKNNTKILLLAVILVSIAVAYFFVQHLQKNDIQQNVFVVLPLTGYLSSVGQTGKLAVEAYFHENPETHLKVNYVDTCSDTAKGLSALAQQSINEDKPIVISIFSIFSKVIVPYIDSRGGFSFPVSTLDLDVFKTCNRFQRVSNSVSDLIDPVICYLKNNSKNVFVIYANDDYGLANKAYFLNNYKGDILGSEGYLTSDKNMRELVQKAIGYNPDAIFVTGTASVPYINIFKDLRDVGYNGIICTDAAFSTPFVKDNLGEKSNGIIFTTNSSLLKNHPSFDMFKRNGVSPYFLSVQIFDALSLLDDCVSKQIELDQTYFTSIKEFEGCADKVLFFPKGNSYYEFITAKFENGSCVEVK